MELFIAIVVIVLWLAYEKGARINAREQVEKEREQEGKGKNGS